MNHVRKGGNTTTQTNHKRQSQILYMSSTIYVFHILQTLIPQWILLLYPVLMDVKTILYKLQFDYQENFFNADNVTKWNDMSGYC